MSWPTTRLFLRARPTHFFAPKLPWFFFFFMEFDLGTNQLVPLEINLPSHFGPVEYRGCADYFDRPRKDLKGCGTYKFKIEQLDAGVPHLLLKVTPDWFVSPTTTRIGQVTFTSGEMATVSVFVCPAGFTASSWLTMLTTSNWDTMNGWLMDRCSVDIAGMHETSPCSTKDSYLLAPDDSVYVVTHGPSAITDVTIVLLLPTYKMITSDVTSILDHLHRAPPSQVSFEWATIQAGKRYTVERSKIDKWLDKCPNSYIKRIMEWVDEDDDEKDDLSDCDIP